MHNYESANKIFPPALIGSGRYNNTAYHAARGGVKNTTGWALMLPYIEATALYNKYNFNVCSSESSPYGIPVMGVDNTNDGIYNARLPFLECPSHPEAGQISNVTPNTPSAFYTRRNAVRTSYFFSTGVFTDYDNAYSALSNDLRQGMFGNDGAAKIATATDGTSNSIAFGEGAGGGLRKTSGEYGPWGMTGTHTCCHGRVVSTITAGQVTPTALEAQEWSINGRWTADTNVPKRTYAWVFNSLHTGGAQFGMGDGSVRFLSQSMDYASFAKLAYVHDGGVVSNLD